MTAETHRCSVDGCPNLAAYEVVHYDFDPAEGAVAFFRDESCPFICIEHAIDNEREASDGRRAHAVVAYPYTNRSGIPGESIYRQLEPAYVA